MLDLVNETPIKADDVKKITVNISDYFATVLRNHQPDTGLCGQVQHGVRHGERHRRQARRPARTDR